MSSRTMAKSLVAGVVDPKTRKATIVMIEAMADKALAKHGGSVVIDGVRYTTRKQMMDHFLGLMKSDPTLPILRS